MSGTPLIHGAAYAAIQTFTPELVALRRDLHAHPELGFEEQRTGARVAEALRAAGVDEVHTGIGKTGVVGVIYGRSSSDAMVGLRADMDALPMQEENDFPWRSTHAGRMHGCGHDGHTAMLLGAARYLAQTRAFCGRAVLVFQPGEEGYAGAKAMIDEGLFTRFPVDAVYALHNWPALPVGSIGVREGPAMAAADRFDILIQGRGGHGAHPEHTIDPVLVAGHIITAAQSLVSRNIDPIEHAVLSMCSLQAGDPGAFSVIPREARIAGTARSFSPAVQNVLQEHLGRLVEGVALGLGATASLNYQRIYPATINDGARARFAASVAEHLVGASQVVRDLPPSMGAEDFAFMLQARPGAYMRLGQGTPGGCFLHNTRYDFNDTVLPLGAALHASLVEHSQPLPT